MKKINMNKVFGRTLKITAATADVAGSVVLVSGLAVGVSLVLVGTGISMVAGATVGALNTASEKMRDKANDLEGVHTPQGQIIQGELA